MTTFCDPLILLTTGPYGKKILKWLVFEYSFLSLTLELIFGFGVVILNKSRGAHFLQV